MKTIYKGGYDYEVSSVKALVQDFKLFCLIIHDPKIHRNFDRYIYRDFDHLDFITGNDLLFFYLGDAPDEWRRHARHRHYYKNWQHEHLSKAKTPKLNNAIEGESAFSLALTLGIPMEDLPCFVLTPDLGEGNYVWFKTCEEKIEKQFSIIGRLASRSSKDEMQRNFQNLIVDYKNDIDLCRGSGQISSNEMIAKKLTEFLSILFTQDASINTYEKFQSVEIANETLLNLYHHLTTSQYEDSKEFEADCLKIASYVKMLKSNNINRIDMFDDCKDLLENESFYLLKLGLSVSKHIREFAVPGNENLENYKFTPSLICLTTAFETEINRSIVSWIRALLGVSMPEMYNKGDKYNPIGTDITGLFINFNDGNRNKWKPPGLRQSWNVFKELKSGLTNFPALTNRDFLLKWDRISQIRNPVAHEGVGTENSYNELLRYWEEFKNNNLIAQWNQLKTQLRT